MVRACRIAESLASLECRLFAKHPIGTLRTLVMAEVLCVHAANEMYDGEARRIRPQHYDLVSRLYGTHYVWLGERFPMTTGNYSATKSRR
jgi:flavin reductase (DIM6/NTAB) family NADH-FMN oxidoreductase RutF